MSCALLHKEMEYLRSYFTQNAHPLKLFNSTLQKSFNKKFVKPCDTQHDVSRKNVYLELPYIGHQFKQMIRENKQLAENVFPKSNAIFYWRKINILGHIFRKDLTKTDVFMGSCVIYKYTSDCCQRSYIGSTVLQIFIRVHKRICTFFRTNRHLANSELSAIRSHCTSND